MNSLIKLNAFTSVGLQQLENTQKTDVICSDKVKLKSKRSQSAMNSKDRLENKYSESIEKSLTFESRKKDKKAKKFEFLAKKK